MSLVIPGTASPACAITQYARQLRPERRLQRWAVEAEVSSPFKLPFTSPAGNAIEIRTYSYGISYIHVDKVSYY